MKSLQLWINTSPIRFILAVIFITLICVILMFGGQNSFNAQRRSWESGPSPAMSYAIMIDAGSSGSRIYIYTWPPHTGNRHDLLNIQQLRDDFGNPRVLKIEPGLSTFGDKPTEAIKHVRPLLDFAVQHIPEPKLRETPVFILATAGMRLLPADAQNSILKNLRTSIREHYSFILIDNHVEVISGKDEGIYSWISVNYLLHQFNHKSHGGGSEQKLTTAGTLDMGGASLQIAFELPAKEYHKAVKDEKKKKYLVEINLGCGTHDSDHTYYLYVATYLGFGGNYIRQQYLKNLILGNAQNLKNSVSSTIKSDHRIVDPCMPYNMLTTIKASDWPLLNLTTDSYIRIIGSGNFADCKKSLVALLNVSTPCESENCKMNGIYHPENGEPGFFYGFSEFWYTMEDVLRMGGTYSRSRFEEAASDYCRTNWNVLKTRYRNKLYPKAGENRFKFQCFKSAWMSAMLHDGFKLPTTSALVSANTISRQDVQWTLGALLYRMRFYPLRTLENVTTHATTVTSAVSTSFWMVNHYMFLLCFAVVVAFILYFIRRIHRISLRQRPYLMSPQDAILHEKRSWAIRHDADLYS